MRSTAGISGIKHPARKPFDPSLLVTFRKRLPEKVMNRIIERSFIEAAEEDQDGKNDKDDHSSFDVRYEIYQMV